MATYYGENSIIKQDKSGLNFGPNFAAKLHRGGKKKRKKQLIPPHPLDPPYLPHPCISVAAMRPSREQPE